MSFKDLTFELTTSIPGLPYPLAKTFINRAWRDILDCRLWSFLVGFGDITSPVAITTGTVDVTLGSDQVVFDATAAAALNAVALANPPLAGGLGSGYQFRLGSTTTGIPGPLYTFTAWDNATLTATLDRVYAGATATGQLYMAYKAYYSPPSTDFVRYYTVTNMAGGYTIRGRKLYYNQQQLNAVDAARGATGDAYIIAQFQVDSDGDPVHEWYPHPVNNRVYNCIYEKRGVDLSETVAIPRTFPEAVLIAKAFTHAAAWAQANLARYPGLQQTNWVAFAQDRKQEFMQRLILAIKQDDEIFPILPFQQGSSFDFPLGGQFMQNHDVSSLLGGI